MNRSKNHEWRVMDEDLYGNTVFHY